MVVLHIAYITRPLSSSVARAHFAQSFAFQSLLDTQYTPGMARERTGKRVKGRIPVLLETELDRLLPGRTSDEKVGQKNHAF
jgi:hypothetical protein